MPCIPSWFWAMCNLSAWCTIVMSFPSLVVHAIELFSGHQGTRLDLRTTNNINGTPDMSAHCLEPVRNTRHQSDLWWYWSMSLCILQLTESDMFPNNGSHQLSEDLSCRPRGERVMTLCHIFWLPMDLLAVTRLPSCMEMEKAPSSTGWKWVTFQHYLRGSSLIIEWYYCWSHKGHWCLLCQPR